MGISSPSNSLFHNDLYSIRPFPLSMDARALSELRSACQEPGQGDGKDSRAHARGSQLSTQLSARRGGENRRPRIPTRPTAMRPWQGHFRTPTGMSEDQVPREPSSELPNTLTDSVFATGRGKQAVAKLATRRVGEGVMPAFRHLAAGVNWAARTSRPSGRRFGSAALLQGSQGWEPRKVSEGFGS